MKLNDVMKDSKIKIRANINGHGILLITKAAVGVRDGLLVDSLTYFDEDLEFRDPAKVLAVNKRDGRTYEFESQSIGPVSTRYGKFHLIRCTGDGIPVNRRQAERYDIDRLGVIKINKSGDIRNALVYDLSMKGIAFILDNSATAKVGDHISASFRYDPNYFHFYACESTVVRVFTIEGQLAVGCVIDSMGADLITLISNKRKEKAGIPVEDMLGMSKSPDSDIASGDKIPVNYVPPLHSPEILDEPKNQYKYELPVPPAPVKKKAEVKQPEPEGAVAERDKEENEEKLQYISLEDAADLIPERSEIDRIKEKKSYKQRQTMEEMLALDIQDFERDEEPEEPAPVPEDEQVSSYLNELNSIREKSPKRGFVPNKNGYVDNPPEVDPAKTLANAANAASASVHLPGKKTVVAEKKTPSADKGSGRTKRPLPIDESLLTSRHDDGFLTPEQIADIIELERISKREY